MDKRWTAVSRFGICLVQVVIHLYIYIFLHLGPKRFRCGRNMLNSETFRINIWIFAVVHVHCLVASTNEQSRCLVVCMDETCIFTIYISFLHTCGIYIYMYIWYSYTSVYTYPLQDPIPVSPSGRWRAKRTQWGQSVVKMNFGYRRKSLPAVCSRQIPTLVYSFLKDTYFNLTLLNT